MGAFLVFLPYIKVKLGFLPPAPAEFNAGWAQASDMPDGAGAAIGSYQAQIFSLGAWDGPNGFFYAHDVDDSAPFPSFARRYWGPYPSAEPGAPRDITGTPFVLPPELVPPEIPYDPIPVPRGVPDPIGIPVGKPSRPNPPTAPVHPPSSPIPVPRPPSDPAPTPGSDPTPSADPNPQPSPEGDQTPPLLDQWDPKVQREHRGRMRVRGQGFGVKGLDRLRSKSEQE